MKKAARQVAVLAGILLVICFTCRLFMKNTYMAEIPLPPEMQTMRPEELHFSSDDPELLVFGEPVNQEGFLRVSVDPNKPGDTIVHISPGDGREPLQHRFHVGPLMTVYDKETGGFTGDKIVLVSVTFFFFAVGLIMLNMYREATGYKFYSYTTIYGAGFSVFALVTGSTLLMITIRHFLDSRDFTMLDAYSAISGAGFQFMLVTMPFLLVFAVAMAVSNIALLRHEPFRPRNVLGIVIAVLLVVGELAGFGMLVYPNLGGRLDFRIVTTIENVYAVVFSYFECMLLGAIVCGLKAARHVPAPDVDYILILGCGFNRDGTLPPLLRGRADRAVSLWRDQLAKTGKRAVLVPSGGQGPDEVMPEGEAIRRYLLTQGIPEECILAEKQSRNTYQNMEFSKALILPQNPAAKVAFVTTNYHVFRSGIWAGLAGLRAEGAGSRTKWWFWPNAFMRECAGLMLNRVRQELLLLFVLIVFFGLLSMTLGW